jgi:uncharacterized protein (AIM24 family)
VPPWKHRRRLVYASWTLGTLMVLSGGGMFLLDMYGVGVALITGGVSLISIVLTAYVGAATVEDVKLWKQYGRDSDG